MDDATAEKIARNNSRFRDANEGIEASAIDYQFDRDQAVPFICECSDRRCTEIVSLTLEDYEHVRSNPRWFAHAPGHEESVDGAVATVECHPRFVLVEKLDRAGEVADRLASDRAQA